MAQQIEALANFVATTRLDDIPAPVRAHAKLVWLDTLGVILAGHERPEVAALRRRLAPAAGGGATYDDNDPTADNHRNIYYYYLEALQHLTPKIYGVTRFSQIRADGGYPIVGDTPTFGLPTSDLWRLSLGLGYHFNDHLIWKVEYMFEQRRLSTGGARDHENMIAAEAAFKF